MPLNADEDPAETICGISVHNRKDTDDFRRYIIPTDHIKAKYEHRKRKLFEEVFL